MKDCYDIKWKKSDNKIMCFVWSVWLHTHAKFKLSLHDRNRLNFFFELI